MAAEPAVTVLLPFYNAAETLDRAVASIANQTFTDWRLLLINNNADDATVAEATRWCSRDARIHLVQEERQGIAHALNTGLRHVRSPLIARMDADDESLAHRLERQVSFLRAHPEIGLVSCRSRFVSSSGNAEGFRVFVDWQNSLLTPHQHAVNRFVESPVAHPGVMFRSALAERWGPYNTGHVPEDYELWLRLMEHGVQFAKLDEELLVWNDHDQRLSRSHPHYSKEAFFEMKMGYLARWLKTNVAAHRRIVVCGTGKLARIRAAVLERNGVIVWGFTDVKRRGVPVNAFVSVDRLGEDAGCFFVNFISKRGVRDEIRMLFTHQGLEEAVDFILAA